MTSARRSAGWGAWVAALLAAPVVAFFVGAALIALLPGHADRSFAAGVHVIVPLWVALACGLPLCRRGWAAWLICAVAISLAVLGLALRGLS